MSSKIIVIRYFKTSIRWMERWIEDGWIKGRMESRKD